MEKRSFADELRAWLKENIPPPYQIPHSEDGQGLHAYYGFLRQWQQTLFRAGWAGTVWPTQYGDRGANPNRLTRLTRHLNRER